MSFSYLRDRIQESGWLGKSILEITDTVHSVIDAPREWLYNTPFIQAIANNTPLGWIMEFLEENQFIASDCGLLFLETGYAVNRAYNSEQYEGQLLSRGNALLNSLPLTLATENLYLASVNGNNSLYQCQEQLQSLTITSGTGSPHAVVNSLVSNAVANLNNLLSEIGEITKETSKEIKRKARDLKRRLKAIAKGVTNNVKSAPLPLSPKFTGSLIPITPTVPTVFATQSIISAIAGWFCEFLTGTLFGVPSIIPIEAMSWAVSSMVSKYFGASGATACRYIAGGVLRGAASILPTLVAPTGLFAGCWGALMAMAPVVISAAVLTITFMRRKQVIGEYLYVMGTEGSRFVYHFVKLFDTDRDEMMGRLIEMKQRLGDEGVTGFDNLTGFAFDDKDKPVMCLDLSQEVPLPVYGEAAIAERFEPFRKLYEEGPLAM